MAMASTALWMARCNACHAQSSRDGATHENSSVCSRCLVTRRIKTGDLVTGGPYMTTSLLWVAYVRSSEDPWMSFERAPLPLCSEQ